MWHSELSFKYWKVCREWEALLSQEREGGMKKMGEKNWRGGGGKEKGKVKLPHINYDMVEKLFSFFPFSFLCPFFPIRQK